jgi:hypothetical protein
MIDGLKAEKSSQENVSAANVLPGLPYEEEVSQPAEGRRPELVAISGLRFWATFLLLAGSVIESLWFDDGQQVSTAHFAW